MLLVTKQLTKFHKKNCIKSNLIHPTFSYEYSVTHSLIQFFPIRYLNFFHAVCAYKAIVHLPCNTPLN